MLVSRYHRKFLGLYLQLQRILFLQKNLEFLLHQFTFDQAETVIISISYCNSIFRLIKQFQRLSWKLYDYQQQE